MWAGVCISPSDVFAQGGSIHILSWSPSHSSVLTFVRGSGLPGVVRSCDCCVWIGVIIQVSCLIFRLPSRRWKMDGYIWHVVHLYQWPCPAGRASHQTTSVLRRQERHGGFISLPKTELWTGQHFMPGRAAAPGKLWHVPEHHNVFLEGFRCDRSFEILALSGRWSGEPGGLRRAVTWNGPGEWWGGWWRNEWKVLCQESAKEAKKNTLSDHKPSHDGHLLQT